MIRLLGVGNSLITGLQGAGKSHFVMSQVKLMLDERPDLKIFLVNVDGVKLESPNFFTVGADFSWHKDAPQNSVIIYDEAGTIERFNNSSVRINSADDVQMLTMARHEGKTIVFVAQDSSLLHPAIRKLLTRHFHFSNPYNDERKTKCFIFPQVQDRLDGQNKSWQKNATEEFDHILSPEIFPLYKSVDDGAKHTKVKQYNQKARRAFAVAIASLILIVPTFFIGAYFAYSYYNDNFAKPISQADNKQSDTIPNNAVQTTPSPASEPASNPIDLVKSAPQSAQQGYIETQNEHYRREQELYAQRLPQDYQIITSNDDLRPAFAISDGKTCKVYNSHGEHMNYTKKECEWYLADVGRLPKSRTQHRFVSRKDPISQPSHSSQPIQSQEQSTQPPTEHSL